MARNIQDELLGDVAVLLARLAEPGGVFEGTGSGGVATGEGADRGAANGTAGGPVVDAQYESAAQTAISVVKSGFGLMPLISGLFGLFGGGGGEADKQTFVKYALPTGMSLDFVEVGGGLAAADFDQMGRARLLPGRAGETANEGFATGSESHSSGSGSGTAPQITVNVQAMDARSFMDRSTDIAAAVRDAMLNLNSINDVVADL